MSKASPPGTGAASLHDHPPAEQPAKHKQKTTKEQHTMQGNLRTELAEAASLSKMQLC